MAQEERSSDSPGVSVAEVGASITSDGYECGYDNNDVYAPASKQLEHDVEDEEAVLAAREALWNAGNGNGEEEDDTDTRASSPVFVPRTSSDESGSRGRTRARDGGGGGGTTPTDVDARAGPASEAAARAEAALGRTPHRPLGGGRQCVRSHLTATAAWELWIAYVTYM